MDAHKLRGRPGRRRRSRGAPGARRRPRRGRLRRDRGRLPGAGREPRRPNGTRVVTGRPRPSRATGAILAQSEIVGDRQRRRRRPRDGRSAPRAACPATCCKLWRREDPKAYHVEYGYSCMGYEIAAGLGVRLADPERDVVVMVGDGSYLMLNSEIVTAVAERLKLTIVVVDNHGFQCILALQRSVGVPDFGNELRFRDPASGRLTGPYVPVDFRAHAEAMGATAILADPRRSSGGARPGPRDRRGHGHRGPGRAREARAGLRRRGGTCPSPRRARQAGRAGRPRRLRGSPPPSADGARLMRSPTTSRRRAAPNGLATRKETDICRDQGSSSSEPRRRPRCSRCSPAAILSRYGPSDDPAFGGQGPPRRGGDRRPGRRPVRPRPERRRLGGPVDRSARPRRRRRATR